MVVAWLVPIGDAVGALWAYVDSFVIVRLDFNRPAVWYLNKEDKIRLL